jgi:hypothetical protein
MRTPKAESFVRLRPIQEISIKARGDTFPRVKWLALCKRMGLDFKDSGGWLANHGVGFIIRASDVKADERGATTVWEVRLTALGTLDSHGLKLWVELCLAAQLLIERANLKDLRVAVMPPG